MRITGDETHVWLLPCVQPGAMLDELSRLLDEDERRRAERYRFERDRNRFVAARGAVRRVLAGYLRCAPRDLEFDLGDHGKPRLAKGHATSLRFNVSTSQEWAMLAVTLGREVGVDVEYIDSRRADRAIARRYFAPREVRALEALQNGEWLRGFFTCWTRKEAFVKATGEGLSRPLDTFEVSVEVRRPEPLLWFRDDNPAADCWRMTDLADLPGYASALVVAGSIGALRTFAWSAP